METNVVVNRIQAETIAHLCKGQPIGTSGVTITDDCGLFLVIRNAWDGELWRLYADGRLDKCSTAVGA